MYLLAAQISDWHRTASYGTQPRSGRVTPSPPRAASKESRDAVGIYTYCVPPSSVDVVVYQGDRSCLGPYHGDAQ
jgi:hypothetical protein